MSDAKELPRGPDLEEHDPYGPSSLGRLLGCPGSAKLSEGEPNLKTEWSKDGDECHYPISLYFATTGFGNMACLDALMERAEEQRERIIACIAFVEFKLVGHKIVKVWTEERVELIDGTRFVNYGRADLIVLTETAVFIFDFKFGRKVHEYGLVLQLANYSAAAMISTPELWERDELPVTAYAYFPALNASFIYQAREAIKDWGPVIHRIDRVIAATKEPDAPVIPGPWCDYCSHLPNCEKVREEGQQLRAIPSQSLLADPKRAVALYDMGSRAEKQYKALKARMKEILSEMPDAFPGLRYSQTNSSRVVSDVGALRNKLVDSGKITAEEFDDCVEVIVKPTRIEESYLKRHYHGRPGPTKKDVKADFARAAGDAISQPTRMQLRRTSK